MQHPEILRRLRDKISGEGLCSSLGWDNACEIRYLLAVVNSAQCRHTQRYNMTASGLGAKETQVVLYCAGAMHKSESQSSRSLLRIQEEILGYWVNTLHSGPPTFHLLETTVQGVLLPTDSRDPFSPASILRVSLTKSHSSKSLGPYHYGISGLCPRHVVSSRPMGVRRCISSASSSHPSQHPTLCYHHQAWCWVGPVPRLPSADLPNSEPAHLPLLSRRLTHLPGTAIRLT